MIDNIKIDDVIKAEYINEFKEYRDSLYKQFVILDTNIFILKKMFKFPFHLFPITTHNIFFTYVFRNFTDICIVTISKLAMDSNGDVLTLPILKNKLVGTMLRDDYKEEFCEELRIIKWDKQIQALLEKVRGFRHTICHNLVNSDVGPIKFLDLFSIRDELKKLLDVIALDTHLMTLYIPYDSQSDTNKINTDIDIILDGIAKRSTLLNLPEKNPHAWEKYQKNKLEKEDKEIYDMYRRKFSLPEQFI